jgi:hypothetical protein
MLTSNGRAVRSGGKVPIEMINEMNFARTIMSAIIFPSRKAKTL